MLSQIVAFTQLGPRPAHESEGCGGHVYSQSKLYANVQQQSIRLGREFIISIRYISQPITIHVRLFDSACIVYYA